MASTHKSLRSGTANKRPTTSIADGQIALNTNAASPGLYFKDSTGASIIKIGPVHVGTTAPNVAPAGSSGNSTGEAWLDTSLTPNGWKVWTGAAWTNATPVGSDTVQGLLELATNAETQAGSDTARAVTPAGLQSKVSDSTSTTSSTTIASSTAVKSAYDLANAALPKSGGTVTGNLEIGTSGSLTFEGATADAFETTLAVVDPTADRTITFPDTTGTVVTTGDTGTVTSAMIANSTIVDADISASAEIAVSKLADGAARQLLQTDAAGTGVEWTTNVDVPGTLDVTGTTTLDSTLSIPLGSAASPTVFFTGDSNTGIYSPGADQVAISTNGTGRLFVDASGNVGINTASNLTKLSVAGVESAQVSRVNISTLDNQNRRLTISQDTILCEAPAGFGTASNQKIEFNPAAGYLNFYTANTERLRITSAGLVGVGTSSPEPGAKLTVAGGIFATSFITASATNAGAIDFVNDGRGTRILSYGPNGSTKTAISFAQGVAGGSATEAMRIDSSGRVGIGNTVPSSFNSDLNTLVVGSGSGSQGIMIYAGTASTANLTFHDTVNASLSGMIRYDHSSDAMSFWTNGTNERARIDSSGRLGIGTTPETTLDVNGAITLRPVSLPGTGKARIYERDSDSKLYIQTGTGNAIRFLNSSQTDLLNIDSSGRLLVGTSTSYANADVDELQIGNNSSATKTGITLGSTDQSGIAFADASDARAGLIEYTHSIDSLRFYTNGASNERMRIRSDGTTLIGKTTGDDTVTGVKLGTNAGDNVFTVGSGASWALMCNRQGDDGTLILFRQANTAEGTISVSGTTVSYNGAHLSRWSQLPSGAERTEILRGSVLSNIDEMCEWGDEENEQLNRMKVSDVEGDKNVSGVFQAWDDDDDTYTNDFYCAMTGDFIIRIAEGTPLSAVIC
jgi:hypothetical protein